MLKVCSCRERLWPVFMVVCCSSLAWGISAKRLYQQAQKAEADKRYDEAYTAYSAALKARPDQLECREGLERARFAAADAHVHSGETALGYGNTTEALREFLRALEFDSGNARARQDLDKTKDLVRATEPPRKGDGAPQVTEEKAAPPVTLDVKQQDPITLFMTEQSDALYRLLGKAAGVNVIFDPDYHPTRVTVDLKNVTWIDALNILGETSYSFWKPVTRNTIFVAPNTSTKRKALQLEALQIFYLSNIAQQNDLTDILSALRNVLTTAKMYAVTGQNAIVVKGTADELQLARSLIHALDRARPEVLVDVYVMQVKRDKERTLGISPPTSLSVSSSSSATLNSISDTSSYTYSLGNAAADLLLSDSSTRLLQNPRIRAVDGQKAVLKIGERIPTATGTYTSGTTASSTTSFQYIDVGVNLEITPTIHENNDVTLKMSVEVSSESGTVTIDSVQEPEIAQQKAEQVVRLHEGEASILAGLVQNELDGTVSGWPGLGELPAVKYMFSTQDHEKVDNEIVFMLVPHIVRGYEPDPFGGQAIGIGTEESPHITLEQPAPLPPAVQAAPATDIK